MLRNAFAWVYARAAGSPLLAAAAHGAERAGGAAHRAIFAALVPIPLGLLGHVQTAAADSAAAGCMVKLVLDLVAPLRKSQTPPPPPLRPVRAKASWGGAEEQPLQAVARADAELLPKPKPSPRIAATAVATSVVYAVVIHAVVTPATTAAAAVVAVAAAR